MRPTHDAIRRLLEASLEYVDDQRARRDVREALALLDAMDARGDPNHTENAGPPGRCIESDD
jgi:hypothetical protein